jgi:hypothetical protein
MGQYQLPSTRFEAPDPIIKVNRKLQLRTRCIPFTACDVDPTLLQYPPGFTIGMNNVTVPVDQELDMFPVIETENAAD